MSADGCPDQSAVISESTLQQHSDLPSQGRILLQGNGNTLCTAELMVINFRQPTHGPGGRDLHEVGWSDHCPIWIRRV
jgi:hypothetical protein